MERIKYLLAGIIMSIFISCSTMVITYDQPEDDMNYNTTINSACCSNCQGGAVTCDMSKCQRCGADISSGSFKLCDDCAISTNSCKRCLGPLNF